MWSCKIQLVYTLHVVLTLCVLVVISTSVHTSSRCVILHMSVITQRGYTALMWAARCFKTEVIVELVKAGANVDMLDNVCQYMYTCSCIIIFMYMYVMFRYSNCVLMLCVSVVISTSTHTSSRCIILRMSVITQRGYSALMEAASEGKTERVVELVKVGANVDMQNTVC